MNPTVDKQEWSTVITPEKPLLHLPLRELWKYRDLILLSVRRDFIAVHKQTIMGPLWYFIQPLISTVVFQIVFGNIAKIPTDDIPPFLFYMSGIVIWYYFSACLSRTSSVFTSNAGLFTKVYFPRLAKKNIFRRKKVLKVSILGRGCGAVGRAVASDTRDLRFES